MKLSDIRGEKALDVVADLIDPIAEIMSDKDITDGIKNGIPKLAIAKTMIKNHKQSVIAMLAILDMEDPETYVEKLNIFTLPKKLLEILNDEDVENLFTSQGQMTE